MDDISIVKEVISEWGCASAGMGPTGVAIGMLQALVDVHGENFSVEKACWALESLSKDSLKMKAQMLEMQK